jgi:GT2 family glycosyltransferase
VIVACIIVNYRSAVCIENLLVSLSARFDSCLGLIHIVDNASGDDSMARIQRQVVALGMEHCVRVIDAGRNGGFGAGNNFAATQIQKSPQQPDVLWLLNPDTLVHQTDLTPALDWFCKDPTIGIVGTGMVDSSGNPDLAGHRDPTPIGEFVKNAGAFGMLRRWSVSDPSLDRPGPVDWVSGASLLIRTEVFEQSSGFDEGFFLYFEEVDLCRRARQAGWKVIYEPRSRIVHLEGETTGIEKAKPMPKYWYDSRRRFFVKHYGVAGLWAADLAWGLGRIVGMLRGRGPSACRWSDLWRCDWPVLTRRQKI